GRLKMLVEMNLLRGHRFRFHHALDAVCPRQIQDVLPHLGRIVGAKHFGSTRFGAPGKQFGKLVEMRRCIRFTLRDLRAQRFEVVPLISLLPACPVSFGKSPQSSREVGIMNRLGDRLAKFCFHQFTLSSSSEDRSKNTMTSFSGPCTPIVSTRSISAVRLGPVMKEI